MYTTIITTDQLTAYQAGHPAGELAIIDCSFVQSSPEQGRLDYEEMHIQSAIYAHLLEDLSGPIIPGVTGRNPLPDPAVFARTLSNWGIGPGVQVVTYDESGGNFASRLWWMLRWLGHEAVAVLDGGLVAWLEADGATSEGRETRATVEFRPQVRPELLASTAQVDAIRNDPAWKLIDVRPVERFRGEIEPKDPIAGHIPGSLNAPWRDNLDDADRLLSPDVLAARFQALFGDTPSQRIVFSCGSGITACHSLLAMRHAGLGEAQLYVGSWSKWITDPGRAVALF